MLFRKTIEESRGRKISRQDNNMYISRGVVQSDGRTLCPALAELIGQKTPVPCDERIYQGLEQAFKGKNKRKSPLLNISVLAAIFMIVASIQSSFLHFDGTAQLFTVYLRIIGIAALYLIWTMLYRKKTGARLTNARRCIAQHKGVTAYQFYISELCWCDTSDADSVSTDAYLLAENIFFNVSFDIFNSAYPGDYFTAAVVDTGSEKLFYIVDYR